MRPCSNHINFYSIKEVLCIFCNFFEKSHKKSQEYNHVLAPIVGTGGPSGRQPGAIFQIQGRERRTPSNGAPIYQGSFEEYLIGRGMILHK